MANVVGEACIDVLDRACMNECPVDCIYIGDRMAYIHPTECIDCGGCELACPAEAIYYEDDVPAEQQRFVVENARFFSEPLPGRTEPLGLPGGATALGPVGVDPDFVREYRR
ncbi:ferredoxin [Nocardia lasii]|uniref:Ferredoxin n=1 Tax=Nocardia lasii TaxID=1616107 RepID=A0ABW1JNL2_9NOCA